MSKLSSCLLVGLSALGAVSACGDDGGSVTIIDAAIDAPPDAETFFDAPPPMYDWSCIGNAMPTTANAMVTLSGTVQEVALGGMGVAFNNVSGATVSACDATGGACTSAGTGRDAMTTTAADGTWSLANVATGSVPLNDYLWMQKAGTRTTYLYPASPFTANFTGIPILTFDDLLISAVLPNLGCTQNDGANGILGLAFTDCADMPISDGGNLTISIKQGGTEVAGATKIDLGAFAPQAAGTFLFCNVPANATTTVDGTYSVGGVTREFREHNVKVVAGTNTATLVRPGW